MNGNELTHDDIQKLLESPVEKRLGVTKRIAEFYSSGGFDQKQMQIAEQIFRALVKDAETEVRKTLSEAIKTSNNAPKEVIMELAKDISEISIPVLEFSEVLNDADLIEIIKSTENVEKQTIVSKRKSVSEELSTALIETHNEEVVDTLLKNDGAEVSEEGYSKIVDNFADKQNVMEAIVEREKLPINVMENLTKHVSKEIKAKLVAKNKAIEQFADAIHKSEEAATMKVIGMKSSEQEYYNFCKLMKQLNISEDLMPVSALCIGNLNLFEVCMARIIRIPILNIRTLLFDQSNKGFKVMYERAKLPESLYEATEILVTVLRDMKDELSDVGITLSKNNANRILANLMIKTDELGDVKNMDYIVTLIRHNAQMDKK